MDTPENEARKCTGDTRNDEPFDDSDITNDEEEGEGEWYPGDGICPSTAESSFVYQISYDAWCSATWRNQEVRYWDPVASRRF